MCRRLGDDGSTAARRCGQPRGRRFLVGSIECCAGSCARADVARLGGQSGAVRDMAIFRAATRRRRARLPVSQRSTSDRGARTVAARRGDGCRPICRPVRIAGRRDRSWRTRHGVALLRAEPAA
jgi:hypothetical protein